MIFITGGKCQGKTEFAKTFGMKVIADLEKTIKRWILMGEDIEAKTQELIDQDCVIVCTEIGCGIVPLEKDDRIYREVTGRVACQIAKQADEVYRLSCGIAQQIK